MPTNKLLNSIDLIVNLSAMIDKLVYPKGRISLRVDFEHLVDQNVAILVVRADWVDKDIHVEMRIPAADAAKIDEDQVDDYLELVAAEIVSGCRHEIHKKKECTCNAYQLENYGCKCGAQ